MSISIINIHNAVRLTAQRGIFPPKTHGVLGLKSVHVLLQSSYRCAYMDLVLSRGKFRKIVYGSGQNDVTIRAPHERADRSR